MSDALSGDVYYSTTVHGFVQTITVALVRPLATMRAQVRLERRRARVHFAAHAAHVVARRLGCVMLMSVCWCCALLLFACGVDEAPTRAQSGSDAADARRNWHDVELVVVRLYYGVCGRSVHV